MNEIKQVIIWRKDLKVRRGKEAAQVAHASMKVILDQFDKKAYPFISRILPDNTITYTLSVFRDSQLHQWLEGSFTKIVLGCDSLDELLELEKQAKGERLLNALITDNGLTEFKEDCEACEGIGFYLDEAIAPACSRCNGTGKISKPTVTCLAIGPDYSEKIDKITGHLKLK